MREFAIANTSNIAILRVLAIPSTRISFNHSEVVMATAIALDSTPQPRSARRRSRRPQGELSGLDHADALQGLLAVLDCPARTFDDEPTNCPCVDCQAQRAAAFSCENCGFRGVPFIHGCKCTRSSVRAMIAYYDHHLRTMVEHAGDRLDADFDTRERIEHRLAELRETAALVSRGRSCIIRPAASSSTERTGQSDDCSHGLAECPCCGGGPSRYGVEYIDPWQRIREIRAVLTCLSSGGDACFTMRAG